MFKRKIILLKFNLLKVRIVFLFSALVHLLVVAIVTLSIDTSVDKDPGVRAYYYTRWKLLTCWFNLITLAYLPTRLYSDWRRSQGDDGGALVTRVEHVSDILMTALLFPVVLFSDVAFWLLYNKNPGYIGHPGVFKYLPNWAQHSLHTVSFFVIILDLVLTPRQRPKTLKPRLVLLIGFWFAYTFLLYFNYIRGENVYPVFNGMCAVLLLAVYVGSLACSLMLFAIQWVAIDYLWGAKQNTNIQNISLKKIT